MELHKLLDQKDGKVCVCTCVLLSNGDSTVSKDSLFGDQSLTNYRCIFDIVPATDFQNEVC